MKTMKKLLAMSFLASMLFGAFAFTGAKSAQRVEAHSTNTWPKNGSGNLMFVNGSGNFARGVADLAIYCFNSESDNAWSDRSDYRVSGDTIRIMIPYKNGQAKTWSKFIICRYNHNMNPTTDGWSGVFNQSDDIYFSIFLNDQNTITVTGINNNKLTIGEVRGVTTYYGISPKTQLHMYLDLSGFQDWEQNGAKFAIFFGMRHYTNEVSWGLSNSSDGYYQSFCWKVNGQDNDHLYECIVPGAETTVWNMVIAARIDPAATSPNWDQKWNQTQDLTFVQSNNNANMIRITDWGSGEIDSVNIISRESRVSFYGQYFLDTVGCSGTGDSDATTSAMWNAVKDEYKNHLATLIQGDVWTTDADKTGTKIQQAMARYDYIVLYKEYKHEDYINRAASPNASSYAYTYSNDLITNDNTIIIVAIITALSTLTLASLIILKRHKHR